MTPVKRVYGEEQAETLLQDTHRLHSLHVTVFSFDGWMWVVALAQLGLRRIYCSCASVLAEEQLEELICSSSLFGGASAVELIKEDAPAKGLRANSPTNMEKNDSRIDATNRRRWLAGHCHSLAEVQSLVELWATGNWGVLLGTAPRVGSCNTKSILTTLNKDESTVNETGSADDAGRYYWEYFGCQELRHRRLGGLTNARILCFWAMKHPPNWQICPSQRVSPHRPTGAFLEPSRPLKEWRKASVCSPKNNGRKRKGLWDPETDGPYPWPWNRGPRWVSAFTIYLKMHIERPIDLKEWGQLMDLREDWAPTLVPFVLNKWHRDGESPPARFIVEFVLETLAALGRVGKVSEMEVKDNVKAGLGRGIEGVACLSGQNSKVLAFESEEGDVRGGRLSDQPPPPEPFRMHKWIGGAPDPSCLVREFIQASALLRMLNKKVLLFLMPGQPEI